MRKKNLSVKVAALAMSGTLAMAPMTVRAEEAGIPATESTGTTAAANTPAAENTSAAAPAATPASGTGSTGSGATASAPVASTVAPAAAGSSATASGTPASGTGATAGMTTAAPAAVSSDVITNSDGSISLREPAADSGTTAPNNVKTVVSDDYQGTKISAVGYGVTVTPEDAKDGTILSDKTGAFNGTGFENRKSGDLVMKGDLSIKEEQSTENYDSTENAAHDVEKNKTYSLKADLDVSAVTDALLASEKVADKRTGNNARSAYVQKFETGLRATFSLKDLDGSFHLPTSLEDAKEKYELSSNDNNKPMIFRINYAKSNFANDKVSIAMDLDLTKMTPLVNRYNGGIDAKYQNLYGTNPVDGKANHIENFDHPVSQWSTYYQSSAFGNLRELVTNSAQKIQLVMKGVKLNSATGTRNETSTTTPTTTAVTTETTTTTEGTIDGTLVGYVKAGVGNRYFPTPVSYKWGAIQNDTGRDKVAGQGNDKVYLTVKFTDKEHTVTPITPVNPVQPVNPGNGGNGGNGGGDRTPIIPTVTPVVTPNENTPADPGQVLGVDRPVSVDNAVSVEDKKGEVLGATRPSTKAVVTRATVSTGDNNYSALWASLFGLSLASLAGFAVLRKKEQN